MTNKNEWKLITLKKILENDGSIISKHDLIKKYGDNVLKCECGHKDLLFKFIVERHSGYSQDFDGYTHLNLCAVKWHFYCPKCSCSIIYCKNDLWDKLMVESI